VHEGSGVERAACPGADADGGARRVRVPHRIFGRGNARASATVSLAKTKLGIVLVNSRGHTLYPFAKDKNGTSACSGSCARFWPPPLSSGKPTAGSGVKCQLHARRWTYSHQKPGRPPLERSLRELILRLADENPRRGYKRIAGELKGLGVTVSATSVRKVLHYAGLRPAPQRTRAT
jgi:secreted repeat protein with Y-X4-D motif